MGRVWISQDTFISNITGIAQNLSGLLRNDMNLYAEHRNPQSVGIFVSNIEVFLPSELGSFIHELSGS